MRSLALEDGWGSKLPEDSYILRTQILKRRAVLGRSLSMVKRSGASDLQSKAHRRPIQVPSVFILFRYGCSFDSSKTADLVVC